MAGNKRKQQTPESCQKATSKSRRKQCAEAAAEAGRAHAKKRQTAAEHAAMLDDYEATLDASYPCKTGAPRTEEERAMMVRIIIMLAQTFYMGIAEAQRTAATLCKASYPNTIEPLWKSFVATGKVFVVDQSCRGLGSPKVCTKKMRTLQPVHLQSIEACISDYEGRAEKWTAKTIKHHLKAEYGIELSGESIRIALRALGYVYGKRKQKGKKYVRAEESAQRMKKYLKQLDRALKLQQAGTHKIVYTDESYIHENHAASMGYYKSNKDEDGVETGHYVARNAKGRRLIIVNAITEDGPLVTKVDDFPIPEGAMQGKTEKLPTAEMIFKAGKATGDYHKNMDGGVFMLWVETRLEPAFKALYPDKKMILVLDNAPYHHECSTGVKLSDKNKQQMAQLMVDYDCTKVTHKAKEWTIDATWLLEGVPRAPNGPSVEAMRCSLQKHLEVTRPDVITSDLKKFFDKQGWELIFTPPYCPKLQPIELFWQQGKQFVANTYWHGRKFADIPHWLRIGWYGGDDRHGCPKEPVDVAKLVKRSLKEANKEVKKNYGLDHPEVGKFVDEYNDAVVVIEPLHLDPLTNDTLFQGELPLGADEEPDGNGDDNCDELEDFGSDNEGEFE